MRKAGLLGYNEICEAQKKDKWLVRWEEEQKVPYAVKGSQWVGYDDPRWVQLGIKVYGVEERVGMGAKRVFRRMKINIFWNKI